MADETAAPSETEAPEPTVESPTEQSKADIPPEVAAALKKANKEAETLRRQLKEYEDRDKTEAEKLAERATEAERRATEAERALVRKTVALAKGVPAALADRLQGDTEEELLADADALLALVQAPPATEPSTFDLGQGARGAAVSNDPLLQMVKKVAGVN